MSDLMVLVYSNNSFFHLAVNDLMHKDILIHTNNDTFSKHLYFNAQSLSLILIDLESDVSTWFKTYLRLSAAERSKFIFYGEHPYMKNFAYHYQVLSLNTCHKSFINQLKVKRRRKAFPTAFKHNLITEREKEIIRFCLDGLTVSEIAEKEKISIKTVYHHQLSACKKLGVTKLTRLLNIWQVWLITSDVRDRF